MLRVLASICMAVLVPALISAGTIQVPVDQPTIQAGLNAASSGDTVLVFAGIYVENIDFQSRAITLIAKDGPNMTFLRPAVPLSPTIYAANIGAFEIRGFTVENGGATHTVVINSARPLITGNVFRNNIPVGSKNVEVISCSGATASIIRNLFYGNGGIGCVGLRYGSSNSRIINNTFDGNERGFFSIADGGTALNNIVTNSLAYGVAAASPDQFTLLDYNDVWNNGTNYMTGVPGSHDISVNPMYVDPAQSLYTLQTGSPCIDAGSPDPQYNDGDGTRNDIGAYFSMASLPRAADIVVNGGSTCFPTAFPEISWTYVDTGLTQTGYQIQIGTDADWTAAEMWDTGPVSSGASSAIYAGSAIGNNQLCYLRVRVQNSIVWGEWTETTFTFHQGTAFRVPTDFSTIQGAIDAAQTCDTIVVDPGAYTENLIINAKGPVIRSLNGAASTVLSPASYGTATITVSNGLSMNAEIRGFTIQGGGPNHTVVVTGASPRFISNIFRNNIPFGSPNVEVISCTNASALIERNLFYNNGGIGCVGLRDGSAGSRIINNTFDGNERGFFSIAGGGTALNNIVTNSLVYGVAALSPSQFSLLDYNDVWNNGTNYMTGVPGIHDISLDPKFVGASQRLYELRNESPCIDAGSPDPQFNDGDGSRNDIGAFSGSRTLPIAANLTISGGSTCFSSTSPRISWMYVDTGLIQTGFQIQVGTDLDWSVTEMWDPGPIFSSDTSVSYGGSALVANQTYWTRVRVSNSIGWGDWGETTFLFRLGTALRVPADFPSIQAAINDAMDCDTIVVDPGNYSVNLIIDGKGPVIRSRDGAAVTMLSPANSASPILSLINSQAGPEVRGFTIQGGGPYHTVVVTNASPHFVSNTFRDNIPFGSTNVEVISCTNASALIERNVFYNNGGIGCVGLRFGSAGSRIINNTFDGNERGFFSIATGGTALNNIVTNSLLYGVAAASTDQFTLLDYNNVWNNGTNYMTGVPGLHDISLDPKYTDRSQRDYSIRPGSPCINRGDPDPVFNDPDGSRNDIGAFVSLAHPPLAPQLIYPPETGSTIIYDFMPQFNWQASTDPDANDTVRYGLQLSLTPSFSLVFSTDSILTTTFVLTDSLQQGTHYWWRVKATDLTGLTTVSAANNFWTWQLGDMDNSHIVDIADLTKLIDHLFISFGAITPSKIADVDGDCRVDIADLTRFIDYLYISFVPLKPGCAE